MMGKIKKRSGALVDFEPEKIGIAIGKAFKAIPVEISDSALSDIKDQVVATLENLFGENTFSVEDVQNIVERILMEAGFFNVAKAYIIYRYEHTKTREEKKKVVLEKIESNDLFVIKRSGKKEKFSSKKLKKSLSWSLAGLEKDVEVDVIVKQAEDNLYDGIKTSEIAKALIFSTRSLIELDPA